MLDPQLDAVAGGVRLDEGVGEPLLRLLGVGSPGMFQRFDFNALAACRS